MRKTVNDMYGMAHSHNKKLLSEYEADFWNEYKTNYNHYDKLFNRFYRSFKYFMQNGDEDLATLTNDFADDVYNHLLINHKKYSELYRMYVVSDNDYSLLDNYNITETMDRDTTSNNTNDYGSRSDSFSNTNGARQDSRNTTIGEQNVVSTGKVAPYDSDNFYNNTEVSDNNGSRSDTESFSKGAETDNGTNTKGSQHDTLNNTGTEDYTLTRKGNIGVQTGADMLDKHRKLWSSYEFYSIIFREIAKELLLV